MHATWHAWDGRTASVLMTGEAAFCARSSMLPAPHHGGGDRSSQPPLCPYVLNRLWAIDCAPPTLPLPLPCLRTMCTFIQGGVVRVCQPVTIQSSH